MIVKLLLFLSKLLKNDLLIQKYKIKQVNQGILKPFYAWCLDIIQTLILET